MHAHVHVVVVVVARLNQPVPTAKGSGLNEGPEILSHPFQGDWGLFFIIGKAKRKNYKWYELEFLHYTL